MVARDTTRTGTLVRWFDRHAAAVMLAPAVLLVGFVVAYPLGYSLWTSVVDYDTPSHPWVGLRNYRNVVEFSAFPEALTRTVMLSAAAVATELVLGCLLALSVWSGGRWRRRLIPLLVLPVFAGGVTAGLFARVLVDTETGPANALLAVLTHQDPGVGWLDSTSLTYVAIVLADAWQWTPLVFLIVYAGLRTIPPELHEAAGLDGASALRAFTFVTVPLVAPFVGLAFVLRLADAMKLFDIPALLGGPREATQTVTAYLYDEGFTYFHLGLASAGSWLLVAAVALLTTPLLVVLARSRA